MSKKYHQRELTMTFRVQVSGHTLPPKDLPAAVEAYLAYWADGRNHLHRELIDEGASNATLYATRIAFEKALFKKYGNEMVQTSPNSSTSRAYLEASRAVEEMQPYVQVLEDITVAWSSPKGDEEDGKGAD